MSSDLKSAVGIRGGSQEAQLKPADSGASDTLFKRRNVPLGVGEENALTTATTTTINTTKTKD